MQILHHEIIDSSMPIWALLVFCVIVIILSIAMFDSKKSRIISSVFAVSVMTLVYWSFVGEIWEHQKVIVTDWNEVYDEGWTIENQEGDIVSLKRKYVSEEE